jgi:hypothetical protein
MEVIKAITNIYKLVRTVFVDGVSSIKNKVQEFLNYKYPDKKEIPGQEEFYDEIEEVELPLDWQPSRKKNALDTERDVLKSKIEEVELPFDWQPSRKKNALDIEGDVLKNDTSFYKSIIESKVKKTNFECDGEEDYEGYSIQNSNLDVFTLRLVCETYNEFPADLSGVELSSNKNVGGVSELSIINFFTKIGLGLKHFIALGSILVVYVFVFNEPSELVDNMDLLEQEIIKYIENEKLYVDKEPDKGPDKHNSESRDYTMAFLLHGFVFTIYIVSIIIGK